MQAFKISTAAVCAASILSFSASAFGAAYDIASGDLLSVKVYRQEDLTLSVRVDTEGFIRVPVAGSIKVVRKNPSDIEKELIARLSKRGYEQPEVVVSVEQFAPRNVFVLGAVKGAANMLIPEGGEMTAMQAISVAGGLAEDADIDRVVVQRKDNGKIVRIAVPARKILNGDAISDVVLNPSDTIVVPHVKAIACLGTVKKPGHFYAKANAPLTVSQIIALAGGVERPNSLAKIRVTRDKQFIEVDIQSLLENGTGGNDMELRAGDVVYVPETRW